MSHIMWSMPHKNSFFFCQNYWCHTTNSLSLKNLSAPAVFLHFTVLFFLFFNCRFIKHELVTTFAVKQLFAAVSVRQVLGLNKLAKLYENYVKILPQDFANSAVWVNWLNTGVSLAKSQACTSVSTGPSEFSSSESNSSTASCTVPLDFWNSNCNKKKTKKKKKRFMCSWHEILHL